MAVVTRERAPKQAVHRTERRLWAVQRQGAGGGCICIISTDSVGDGPNASPTGDEISMPPVETVSNGVCTNNAGAGRCGLISARGK